jgi:ATP-binding cassette subfamily B protein
MKKLIKPYFGYILLVLLLALGNVAGVLYAPVLTGNAIDKMLGEGSVIFEGLTKILLSLGIVILLTSVTQWLMSIVINRVAFDVVNNLRDELFYKLHSLPLKSVDRLSHGDYISIMTTDVEQVSDGLIMGFTHIFTGLVTILGTLCFMLSINVKITIVVIVITPLSMFVSSFVAKHTYKRFKEQSATRGELTSISDEMIDGFKTVKAFAYEDTARERFDRVNEHLKECSVKAIFFSALTNPTTRFVNSIVYASVGILGAFMAIEGAITVGQLSCLLNYANQYTKPFNEISGVITEFQSARASLNRVMEFLAIEPEPADAEGSRVLNDADGTVDIDNISFAYSPDRPLIEDFSMHVDKGARIAIVGPTGCGKTTFINLLMRFYEVDSGSIKISGTPSKQITRDSLRTSFGMVLQDTWLMDGTIHDNIAYGKPDASREEVIKAAKAAHAHSFIVRLPKGYDTELKNSGEPLSQGQKQLLCIARVMLCTPGMLILDEATSSIDTRTELIVQDAFNKMMEGRTNFVVAHRLSTIKKADCILVMNAGHIIERGTHEELLEKRGFYYNLYRAQYES